jgi:hypothetical protein
MFGNIQSADEVRDAMAWYFRSSPDYRLMEYVVQTLHTVLVGKSFRRENAIEVIVSLTEESFNSYRTTAVTADEWKAEELRSMLEDGFKGVWPEIDVASFELVIEYPPTTVNDQDEDEDEEVTTAQQVTGPAQEAGLNNGWFRTDTTIRHDSLRFRSKSEIAIYEELKRRRLLFFPNAAAIIGGREPAKKEPDFLICDAGKWGILEVMGSRWHTSDNAVKDHDRARLFKDFGILCIEFFDADKCRKSPAQVVDKFLSILAKH